MFGITTPPLRPNTSSTARNIQNPREEIRTGTHSSTYDTGASERMKMDYLKKERERREKERNKLAYDGKKREYDAVVDAHSRLESEHRRLESELRRYEQDATHAKGEERRLAESLPSKQKEEVELERKIQTLESELLSLKNKQLRLKQDIVMLEHQEKTASTDAQKKDAYFAGLKAKAELAKKRLEEYKRDADKLHKETEDLKRLIQ